VLGQVQSTMAVLTASSSHSSTSSSLRRPLFLKVGLVQPNNSNSPSKQVSSCPTCLKTIGHERISSFTRTGCLGTGMPRSSGTLMLLSASLAPLELMRSTIGYRERVTVDLLVSDLGGTYRTIIILSPGGTLPPRTGRLPSPLALFSTTRRFSDRLKAPRQGQPRLN